MLCKCGCGGSTTVIKYTNKRKNQIKGNYHEYLPFHSLHRPLLPRFWKSVDKTGYCWIWTAYKDPNGYGQLSFMEKLINAHRASWILEYGSIPPGMNILHICDNPSCVNISHLMLGTQKDNVDDMHAKGRRTYITKLSTENVIEARYLKSELGMTHLDIANKFNVSKETMRRTIKGLVKKHNEVAA